MEWEKNRTTRKYNEPLRGRKTSAPRPPGGWSLKELSVAVGVKVSSLSSAIAAAKTKPPVLFYVNNDKTNPRYDKAGFIDWFKNMPIGGGCEQVPDDSVSRGDLAPEIGMTASKLKALIEAAPTKPSVAYYDKRDHTRPRYSRAEFMAWWAKHGAGHGV